VTATLWPALRRRRAILVDLVLILLLGFMQIGAWVDLDIKKETRDREEVAQRLRDTTTAGLTVVGILVPLTVIAVQIRASTSDSEGSSASAVATPVLVDLLVANFWLLLSLLAGLYVLYFSAYKGYHESLFMHKEVGVLVGFQLFLLFIGVLRLVLGLAAMVSRLIPEEGPTDGKRKPT
jgi:hypothetical protein